MSSGRSHSSRRAAAADFFVPRRDEPDSWVADFVPGAKSALVVCDDSPRKSILNGSFFSFFSLVAAAMGSGKCQLLMINAGVQLTLTSHLAQLPVLGTGPCLGKASVKVVKHAGVVVRVDKGHDELLAGAVTGVEGAMALSRARHAECSTRDAGARAEDIVTKAADIASDRAVIVKAAATTAVEVVVTEEVDSLAGAEGNRVLSNGVIGVVVGRKTGNGSQVGHVGRVGTEVERGERVRDLEVLGDLGRGDELSKSSDVDYLFFERLLFLVVILVNDGITSVEDDAASTVNTEMVHEKTHGASLVKVGARLLEQRVDGELEVKLLDLKRSKCLGEGGLGAVGLNVSRCKEASLTLRVALGSPDSSSSSASPSSPSPEHRQHLPPDTKDGRKRTATATSETTEQLARLSCNTVHTGRPDLDTSIQSARRLLEVDAWWVSPAASHIVATHSGHRGRCGAA